MADVGGNTLLMAIQAVADAIGHLRERLKTPGVDALDDTEMLLAYERAADELRRAYEVARLTASNLPPYGDLLASEDA